MTRRRDYKLDLWDVLLLVVGLGIGIAVQALFAFPFMIGIALGLVAWEVRRRVSSRKDELFYAEPPVYGAFLPLVVIAVGAFLALGGGLVLTWLIVVVSSEAAAWDWRLLLHWRLQTVAAIPLLVLVFGAGLARWGARLRHPRPENVTRTEEPPRQRELGE